MRTSLSLDFSQTILQSFEAMHRQKNSLVSLFDSTQLPALSRVCVVRRLAEGEKMIREGEMATFLGFVMTGRLKVKKKDCISVLNFCLRQMLGELAACVENQGVLWLAPRAQTVFGAAVSDF